MTPTEPTTQDALPELDPAQKRRFVILALVLILVVPLLIAEVAVRSLFRYNTPDTLRAASLQYLPSTVSRHRLAPNQEVYPDRGWGDATVDDSASERVYRTNALGYRGPEVTMPKPDGTCRLVVLGGSAVFDIGASEGSDWPRQLEARLAERWGTTVVVVNAGVPGHSSSDAVGKLRAQLWMAEPDGVVLYNAWNDIKTFRQIAADRPLIALTEPFDPKADPFQNYRGPVDRLLGHSQVYIKLRNRFLLWRYDVGLEGRREQQELADSFSELGVEQYRLNIEAVVALARAGGATPILATQASLLAADTPEALRSKIAYDYQGLEHDALVRAMDTCNTTVRTVATQHQALLVDLATTLAGRSELFDDHVHTNAEGSAALAETLAVALGPHEAQICGAAAEESSELNGESTTASTTTSSAPASPPSP